MSVLSTWNFVKIYKLSLIWSFILVWVSGLIFMLSTCLFKGDLEYNRAVSLEKQMKFANDHGIQTAHNISARTGENVKVVLLQNSQ